MTANESSLLANFSITDDPDEPPVIKPLTRGRYKRLPEVEQQIADAVTLDSPTLVQRAQQRDETTPEFLSAEALVYFIRRTILNDDKKTRDALFRELFERCKLFFRGQFRGFSRENREDLQSEVITRVVEDLFASDDRGDFMQVRFWKYLKIKSIDACRKTLNHTKDTESLDTSYSGDGVSEGLTRLEREVDPKLLPEERAIISEAFAKLTPRLRQVYLLRNYFGLDVGTDNPAKATGDELTIAAYFGRSGRTIRNWLREADKLLAEYREKIDGE